MKKKKEEIGRWLALRAGELFEIPFDASQFNLLRGNTGRKPTAWIN